VEYDLNIVKIGGAMQRKKAKPASLERDSRDSYHHGALRDALLGATDEILVERGVEGFTLREAARRAGVSVAAPAHHFGSAAGLLTEVAILGFEELTRYLRKSAARAKNPSDRMRAQGMGYVRFAIAYPGRFHLMFRRDLLVADDPRLRVAGDAALAELEQTVRALRGLGADKPIDGVARAVLLGAWSTVHGFAHLALEGKFDDIVPRTQLAKFVSEVLPEVLRAQWPDAKKRRSG
jgi:AcrR family transcriptional regulator